MCGDGKEAYRDSTIPPKTAEELRLIVEREKEKRKVRDRVRDIDYVY